MRKDMVGTYGEYFVVTRLLSWGYPAVVVPGPFKYDVVVDIGGRALRVQVKSTDTIKINKAGKETFSFECRSRGQGYSRTDYDIMALVAIPNYRILFLPNESRKQVQRKIETFDKGQEITSWEDCLEYLNLLETKV